MDSMAKIHECNIFGTKFGGICRGSVAAVLAIDLISGEIFRVSLQSWSL